MTRRSILTAMALGMALVGCRLATNPMSELSRDRHVPPRPAAVSRAVLPADEDWVPLLQRLDVRIAGPFLMVNGLLEEHAPVPFNGGWSLQMLLDTDQDGATGYPFGELGCEFVVRGPERQEDGSLVVRITTGGGGPGGWGSEIGTAAFVENDLTFNIRVPLSLVRDEGALDWVFYAWGSSTPHVYFGSCSPHRHWPPAATLIQKTEVTGPTD